MRFTSRWLTWLCLSLMLWTAVAESTHTHPNQSESSSCSICVMAHSTVPTASPHQARPIFTMVGLMQEEQVLPKAQFAVSRFVIRGPPAV